MTTPRPPATKPVWIRLSPAHLRKLSDFAKADRRSRTSLIAIVLEDYIDRRAGQKKG